MKRENINSLIKSAPAFLFDADAEINSALSRLDKKIIVLDDDPTGVQTVNNISVYTSWDRQSIDDGFSEPGMFFILTNTRGVSADDARRINADIAMRVDESSQKHKKDYILISRSDSTLRGHYPLETEVLKETLEKSGHIFFDGEIICPFFIEGGRYTHSNIHYVLYGEELVPAGDTEFAKDKSFGYINSDLSFWVEEKTEGRYKHKEVVCISLETIRQKGPDAVAKELTQVSGFGKIIVNALCYNDIKLFLTGYIKAVEGGKNFIFRSAAAIPKILGSVEDRSLLNKEDLTTNSASGGLTVIGSHVAKTTKQLESLIKTTDTAPIEFNQHLVLKNDLFLSECKRVCLAADDLLASGKDVVIYTKRERLDINSGNPEDELKLSRKISDAVTGIVKELKTRPAYIMAKGGITASDIGTSGLSVKRAIVAGQIIPGVPVWKLGDESKYPGMAYIIFPGNVGDEDALANIVKRLR